MRLQPRFKSLSMPGPRPSRGVGGGRATQQGPWLALGPSGLRPTEAPSATLVLSRPAGSQHPYDNLSAPDPIRDLTSCTPVAAHTSTSGHDAANNSYRATDTSQPDNRVVTRPHAVLPEPPIMSVMSRYAGVKDVPSTARMPPPGLNDTWIGTRAASSSPQSGAEPRRRRKPARPYSGSRCASRPSSEAGSPRVCPLKIFRKYPEHVVTKKGRCGRGS